MDGGNVRSGGERVVAPSQPEPRKEQAPLECYGRQAGCLGRLRQHVLRNVRQSFERVRRAQEPPAKILRQPLPRRKQAGGVFERFENGHVLRRRKRRVDGGGVRAHRKPRGFLLRESPSTVS